MTWKNWGDHPIVVGIGIIGVLTSLGYTVYEHHIKQEDASRSLIVPPRSTSPSIPSPQITPATPSIPSPSESVDNLEIPRKDTTVGIACTITVEVNGKEIGKLSPRETLKYTVPTGEHVVNLSGCWHNLSMNIVVKGDQKLKFETTFVSTFLQGGLRLYRIN